MVQRLSLLIPLLALTAAPWIFLIQQEVTSPEDADAYEKQIATLNQTVSGLHGKVAELEREVASGQDNMVAMSQRFQQASRARDEAVATIQGLEERLAQTERENRQLESTAITLQNQLNTLSTAESEGTATAIEATAANERLRAQVERLSRQLNDASAAVNLAAEQNSSLIEENQRLRSAIGNSRSEPTPLPSPTPGVPSVLLVPEPAPAAPSIPAPVESDTDEGPVFRAPVIRSDDPPVVDDFPVEIPRESPTIAPAPAPAGATPTETEEGPRTSGGTRGWLFN